MKRRSIPVMIAGFVITAVLLSSCGSGDADVLIGYEPPSAMHVGGEAVREAGTNEQFPLVARRGEVLIVYFGYTHCPDVCPATLAAVKNAKKRIGDDLAARVDLAMITVDPERDTVEILPRYLSSFSDRYHALVPASDEELRSVEAVFQATSSVTKKPDGTVEVVHGGTAYVVDENGDWILGWPFGLDAESMAHDLRILLDKKGTSPT